MARYKYIDTNPRFLTVDLGKQLIPGTFEHAVHHLLEAALHHRADRVDHQGVLEAIQQHVVS